MVLCYCKLCLSSVKFIIIIIIIIENMDVGIASKSTFLTTLISFLILKHKF